METVALGALIQPVFLESSCQRKGGSLAYMVPQSFTLSYPPHFIFSVTRLFSSLPPYRHLSNASPIQDALLILLIPLISAFLAAAAGGRKFRSAVQSFPGSHIPNRGETYHLIS